MELEFELAQLDSRVPAPQCSAVLEKAAISDGNINTGWFTAVAHLHICLDYQQVCMILVQFLIEHFTIVFKC